MRAIFQHDSVVHDLLSAPGKHSVTEQQILAGMYPSYA